MARLSRQVVQERETFVKGLYATNEKLRIEDVQTALKTKDGFVMSPKRIAELRDAVRAGATVEVTAGAAVVTAEPAVQVQEVAAEVQVIVASPRVAFLPPRKLNVVLVDSAGKETKFTE